MSRVIHGLNRLHDLMDSFRSLDFLGPVALRLYLAPIFLTFGWKKVEGFEGLVQWFGDGLGLPLPWLMALLVTGTELVGGLLLLLGLATRYVAVPLMVTMIVAMSAVHWQHGWYAVAPTSASEHIARPLAALGVDTAKEALEQTRGVAERQQRARALLREHGDDEWLTERGNFVALNNGIEFAATYFVMLLMLFFVGAGRWLSLDYWILRRFRDVRD